MVVVSEVAFLDSVLHIAENVSRNNCSILGGRLGRKCFLCRV